MRASNQQAAGEKKPKEVLPSGKAIVKAVPSGDNLVLTSAGKKAIPGDPYCYLAYVNVPKIGNPNRQEEPFAYEAREAIRGKIIG